CFPERRLNPVPICRDRIRAARCRSGGEGVTLLDRRGDPGPAFPGGKIALGLDGGDLGGERLVLDAVGDPAGVIALAEVMQPRLVVDAIADLDEGDEIGGAQAQPLVRAAKPEAPVLAEAAFRVLAQVPPELLARRPAAE